MSKRSGRKRSNKKNKCGPGEIKKVGYKRKGYVRNSFTRKDGTIVPETYIPATNVPSTCVKDVGKPGKGPKILPKLGTKIRFHKYGYGIHRPESVRRAALRAASKDYNTLEVLRRLNLIRNYQPIPENKEIFSQDVDYMKKLYRKEKEMKNRNTRSGQRGGQIEEQKNNDTSSDLSATSDFSETSESDHVVDKIPLGEQDKIIINSFVDREKICGPDGKCTMKQKIYEKHNVGGKIVEYFTIDNENINQIHDFNKNKNISEFSGLKNGEFIIGIKIDGQLQGYCTYEMTEVPDVVLVKFCTNKGYHTALNIFMKKYFKVNDINETIY